MPQLARQNDLHTCGTCSGSIGSIVGMLQSTVFANGRLASVKGDTIIGCEGGTLTRGASTSVFAEGKPVHRLRDDNTCNGTCITASSNVFVN